MIKAASPVPNGACSAMSDDIQRMRAAIDARKNQQAAAEKRNNAAAEKQKLENGKKAKPQPHERATWNGHVRNLLSMAMTKMRRQK
jgi:hypothetical protein